MSQILQSLNKTLLAGLILLIAIVLIVGSVSGSPIQFTPVWTSFLFRWLHVACGIMWIGLLYYFNFVQIPSMPKIPDEQKPAIGKVIAPAALFWFRWSALATVVTGLVVASLQGYLHTAFTLQPGFVAIGIGMWIALVMAFNVWFIIWPNQKKALGIVAVEPEAKARAARLAMLTSRTNTMLSIPMLYMMVAQSHGGL
jgi:uncharacterized membrane protein